VSFKRFIPFLLAFVLPLLIIYAWWGGFNPVGIQAGQLRGPYTYAYVEYVGDYARLPDMQAKVEKALLGAGIQPGHPITVLYSDPHLVKPGERQARTGYLVPSGTRMREPFLVDTLPARPVVHAQVRAAVLLAPSRAYQALDGYMKERGSGIRMPTVEIFEASDGLFTMGTLHVEIAE
jgi:hypothetical protein